MLLPVSPAKMEAEHKLPPGFVMTHKRIDDEEPVAMNCMLCVLIWKFCMLEGGSCCRYLRNTTTSHVATLCQEKHSPTVQGGRKPGTKQKQRSCAIIAQPSKQGTHHVQLLAPFLRFKSSFSPSEVSLKLKVNTPEEPKKMVSG